MPVTVRCLAERPAEVAHFLATAAGRSFATGAAFERALDEHGAPADRRCFVVADGSRLLAALPGRLEWRLGGAWLRAQPHGTPAGPVYERNLDAAGRAVAAEALWPAVERTARHEGWLGGDVTLSGPSAEPGAEALLPPPSLGRIRREEAHVVDLSGGVAAWQSSLDKRARQMVRRAREKGVTAGPARGADDLATVYSQFQGQARSWGVRQVRPLSFYRQLLAPPTDARLWVGRHESEVVCGVLAFVLPEETFVWWSGASVRARAVNAFAATLATLIEDCGSARVSLGFSGGKTRLTDFKRQLGGGSVTVPILELAPRPRTPWHALLVAGRRALRRRALARSGQEASA